jgi:hypothetical protein
VLHFFTIAKNRIECGERLWTYNKWSTPDAPFGGALRWEHFVLKFISFLRRIVVCLHVVGEVFSGEIAHA